MPLSCPLVTSPGEPFGKRSGESIEKIRLLLGLSHTGSTLVQVQRQWCADHFVIKLMASTLEVTLNGSAKQMSTSTFQRQASQNACFQLAAVMLKNGGIFLNLKAPLQTFHYLLGGVG